MNETQTPVGSDDSNHASFSVSPPQISLPKGGGAIRGIGEKFGVSPATGTGSLTIPIATSPGRSGFGPQLSLSYDSPKMYGNWEVSKCVYKRIPFSRTKNQNTTENSVPSLPTLWVSKPTTSFWGSYRRS